MQIMFPILENLDSANLVSANHYWLFNDNIRDRRFEVFDSWRSLAQSKTLDDNARLIAATVRSLWDQHYHESCVSLDDFRLKEIDVPKQDNEWVPFIVALSPSQKHDFFVLLYMLFHKMARSLHPCFLYVFASYDCGIFTSTIASVWEARNLPNFGPKDIPNIRKNITSSLINTVANKAPWQAILKLWLGRGLSHSSIYFFSINKIVCSTFFKFFTLSTYCLEKRRNQSPKHRDRN